MGVACAEPLALIFGLFFFYGGARLAHVLMDFCQWRVQALAFRPFFCLVSLAPILFNRVRACSGIPKVQRLDCFDASADWVATKPTKAT